MGWFSGEKASIMTKEVVDPQKKAVSTPMSSYLASEVGKGLPQYGGDLSYKFSPEETRSYSDFLKLDAGDWFDKAVAEPAMKEFKEDLLPEIREGYAGNLRGSGRYSAEEAGINEFTEMLAQGRYKAEREIPAQQFAMASQYKTMMDVDFAREYTAWMATLPQNNPALGQALTYLNENTSTGTTILTALDPGKEGGWKDLLKAGAHLAAAFVTGGASIPASAASYAGADLGQDFMNIGSVSESTFQSDYLRYR